MQKYDEAFTPSRILLEIQFTNSLIIAPWPNEIDGVPGLGKLVNYRLLVILVSETKGMRTVHIGWVIHEEGKDLICGCTVEELGRWK